MQTIKIPTGFIVINDDLETLSIGDYGKVNNIKANFLGFTKDINGVSNNHYINLSEKWVMTLSTQYGCSCSCSFCDVPNIPFKGNVTYNDLVRQFINARYCFPDVTYTDRLNIHFARMGEPAFNYNTIFKFCNDFLYDKYHIQEEYNLRLETIHPVFTTMCPEENNMYHILHRWMHIKNETFNGQAGLQLSINSTDSNQRKKMFAGRALELEEISNIFTNFSSHDEPLGRKICLNFALADEFIIDATYLAKLFDPKYFMCKITPIHNNTACSRNKLHTTNGYKEYTPYKKVEEDLIKAGFDVLVFIPSSDEEDYCVTCGNAILGGSKIAESFGCG